jgi:multiple sugar transport system substrate-binding protein
MPKLVEEGGVTAGGMAALILTDDPEKRRAACDYLLYGTGAKAQAMTVENTGYRPVNSGAMAVLADVYKDHPQVQTSAQQTDRAYP